MRRPELKGRRPTPGSFAALLALAALLAPLLLGGCSRLLSIVDPSGF